MPSCPSARRTATCASSARSSTTSTRSGAQIPLRTVETAPHPQRSAARGLRRCPQPTSTAPCRTTGLKAQTAGGVPSPGRRTEHHQTVVELVDSDRLRSRQDLADRRQPRTAQRAIHDLPVRSHLARNRRPDRRNLPLQEIVKRYRNEPDQEVKEYCTGQTDRANRLMGELERLIKSKPGQGSFIFRGQVTAVESLTRICSRPQKASGQCRRTGLRPLQRSAGAGRNRPGREIPARSAT